MGVLQPLSPGLLADCDWLDGCSINLTWPTGFHVRGNPFSEVLFFFFFTDFSFTDYLRKKCRGVKSCFCESVTTPVTPAVMQVDVKNVRFNGFSFRALRRSIASIEKKNTACTCWFTQSISSCTVHIWAFNHFPPCVLNVRACGVVPHMHKERK